MRSPGYYSADEALYYLAPTGSVYLVGSIETETAVWERCDAVPADATPSDLHPEFAEELEVSRIEHGIS